MPLYSLKAQTLLARWKHFCSSSSAIVVDDAVPQWGCTECVDTRRDAISYSVFVGKRTTPIKIHREIQAVYG